MKLFEMLSPVWVSLPEGLSPINSLEDLASDYSDWPEDQGFGSSDMTFVRKNFIDSMINYGNLNGYYETDFKPYLKVVEYSEFEKEEYDLRREQGI